MTRMITTIAFGVLFAGLTLTGLSRSGNRPSLVSNVHSDNGCSVASVSGTYGFYRHGTTGVATANANSLAAVGIISFDGSGNVVAPGHQAISKDGTISDFNQPAGVGGSYQVNADCSGQEFSPAGALIADFVVVDGGKGLYLLSLSPGNAVVGVATRIRQPED